MQDYNVPLCQLLPYVGQKLNYAIHGQDDIDHILRIGNELYKNITESIGYLRYLGVDDLPEEVNILGHNVSLEISQSDLTGEIRFATFVYSLINFMETIHESYTGVLIIIQGVTLAIFFPNNSNKFYLFDSHSRNHQGRVSANGSSVLITFDSVIGLQEYIIELYHNQHNSESTYFQLCPINVVCPAQTKANIYSIIRKFKCKSNQQKRRQKSPIKNSQSKMKYATNP